MGELGFARAREQAVSENSVASGIFWQQRLRTASLCLLLVTLVVAVYHSVHHFAFLANVDDDAYVFNNSQVLGPLNWAAIKQAFTHSFLLNYDPLTFLGHSINVRLFGLNAGGHHAVNLYLHVVNVVLLFLVLRKATGFTGRSLMVAALFAVHPINVENVAWVSELKTLLSGVFFFLSIGAYVWYARKPALMRMLAVTFLFGLGLLAKPQIITLPFVLLLLDYWPLQRLNPARDINVGLQLREFWKLVWEKAPLFFVAAVDALITLHSENKPWVEKYTFVIRLGTAIRSYALYVCNAFWPVNLAFDYPHPGYALRWMEVGAAFLLLAAITAFVLYQRNHRYLLVGWLWFLGTMLPTINLVQIDLSPMADRYAYIPLIGVYLLVCWGVADLAHFEGIRSPALASVGVALVLVLGVLCHRQVSYWSDTDALWKRSLAVTGRNWGSERGYGTFLLRAGRINESLVYLEHAAEDRPQDIEILLNTAMAEHQQHHLREAVSLYQKSLLLSKSNKTTAQIFANMGHAYSDLGELDHAQECYRQVHLLRPPASH